MTALGIVSSDTHIGPLLREQLRSYCPPKHIDAFDEYAAAARSAPFFQHPNLAAAGHHDVHPRLRDMDRDGVACEVVFHGSQNGEPMPFQPVGTGLFEHAPAELLGAGYRIYNRWLADVLSVEPVRHVGLAYLPLWDIEEAIAELEWAHE